MIQTGCAHFVRNGRVGNDYTGGWRMDIGLLPQALIFETNEKFSLKRPRGAGNRKPAKPIKFRRPHIKQIRTRFHRLKKNFMTGSCLKLPVTVETRQQINSEIGKQHGHKSKDGKPGNPFAMPSSHQSGVQQGGVNKPGDQ